MIGRTVWIFTLASRKRAIVNIHTVLLRIFYKTFKVVLRSKNTFIFSPDFKTLFTKLSPREILGLNFEKKTVYWSAIITPERIQ